MTPRLASASLAFVVLCPLAAFAEPLEIPELWIRIANLPSGEIKPQVIRRVDGYEAILQLGAGTLTIARLDEPVSAGSSVGDAAYRGSQQDDFNEDLGPQVYERASTLAGQDAWTRFSAYRRTSGIPQGSADDSVRYMCVTYAIVDQHLYRLVSNANGGVTKPPDFDAAVHAMSGVTFVAVDRSADSARAPVGLLKMPKWQPRLNTDWYPPVAQRRGEQGVVDLEFSIDGSGHVRDVRQTFAASDTLGKAARQLLQSSTYRVNSSWQVQGYQTLRFNLEFQFLLSGNSRCPHALPRVPGEEAVVVCGSRL